MIDPNPPVTEQELVAFGNHYGLELPKSYRRFLVESNGGRPVPAAFPISGLENNPTGLIQAFFGLNAGIKTEDLNAIMADLVGLIPSGVLPIACTEGDDFLCVDLRKTANPIVLWDRRPFWGSGQWNEADLYPVADDFEALIEGLAD